MKPNFLKTHVWLLFILVWAAVLRFYAFAEIPFMADEFSALSRLHFKDFTTLIDKGVLPDFHPAGTHVFLWLWGNTFGFEEWILKLPFVFFGLGSVVMVYLIGCNWYNKSTGLLAAAFLACTQYFILYSQIARPYGMGLLFCLLAVWYWKKLVFDEDFNLKALVGWVLSAVAVAYIHYFALLFLVLVGLSGVFFITRKRLLLYAGSAAAISLLYLPHFPLFFTQLSKGGVESWLAKPTWAFVPDYIQYLFHFNWWFIGFMLLLFVMGLALPKRVKLKPLEIKLACISIFWWIACFLVGYYYSIYNSAILQFSGLLFSAPLGVLGIFYFLRLREKFTPWVITSVLIIGTFTLVEGRQHYFMLYQSPYEQFVKEITNLQQQQTNTLYVLAEEDHIYRYYAKRFETDTNTIIETRLYELAALKQMIDTSHAEQVAMGLMYYSPLELVQYAKDKFPYLLKKRDVYQGSFYVFSKLKPTRAATLNPYFEAREIKPSSRVLPNSFGAGIELIDVSTVVKHPQDIFDFEVIIGATFSTPKTEMVVSILHRDSIVFWRSSRFLSNQTEGTVHYKSFTLPEELINQKGLMLRCMLWNQGIDTVEVERVKLSIRKGNPFLYGLYGEM